MQTPVEFIICLSCLDHLLLVVFLSFPARHQHEKGLQELHYPGPTGGLQKFHPELSDGDVPTLWQATSSQHPHSIQVCVSSSVPLADLLWGFYHNRVIYTVLVKLCKVFGGYTELKPLTRFTKGSVIVFVHTGVCWWIRITCKVQSAFTPQITF